MAATHETFFIGAFAKAAGVNVETIRFYQRKRLLAEPPSTRRHSSLRKCGGRTSEVREVRAAVGVQSG